MSSSKLSVRAQLSLAFGSMTALVAISAIAGLTALSQAHETFQFQVNDMERRSAWANDILDAANARAIAARNLVLVGDAAGQAVELEAVKAAQIKLKGSIEKLRDHLPKDGSDAEEERKFLDGIQKEEAAYEPIANEVVRLATSNQASAAIEKMNKECRPHLKALLHSTNLYIANLDQDSKTIVEEAGAAYANRRKLLFALCTLALGLAAGLTAAVVRSLTRALGAEPRDISKVVRTVADGDLSPVPGADRAPTGSVLASVGEMQAQLARLVGQVRQASETIATGSAEIAGGNSDLSQRTEQQASNLQETAASMEEMAATVKHNADTAQQATQLSASAAAAATQGGEVVGQVIGTMDGISDSSRKIADIIGVIDGIAFQTNILALNAAVEAARAGEQGRGFAVVAGEVRTLAQRSATAAREIKSLINDSVERVDAGSRLVQDAGRTMDDIVTQIRRVNDLIGEISSATTEQTAGIGQISAAVNDLDRVTQQNAALVEQSAASAESLRQQATQLTEMVSVFRLGAEASARPAAPRQAAAADPGLSLRPAKPQVGQASPAAAPRAAPVHAKPTVAAADGHWETF